MNGDALYSERIERTGPDSGLEAIWLSPAGRAGSYRVLPDGRCDIVVRFETGRGGLRDVTAIIAGPATRYYDIVRSPHTGFVGARLRPGWCAQVLGVPPAALVDAGLAGADALRLLPALGAVCAPARDADALAARLAALVAERSRAARRPPEPLRRSVGAVLHAARGRLRICEIAAMHGVSERTIHRIIREDVGLAPKAFANILQFHHALRLLRDRRVAPAEAAQRAGFSDQAHMSRVVRRLGGFSPARLPEVTLVTLGG